MVTADDFLFKGIRGMGSTTNAVGSNVTIVNVKVFPGLNTLGISFVRIDYAPRGLHGPYYHPRATEVLTVIEGSLQVGFITTDPDNKLFTKRLEKGDIFILPEALIHFQQNVGNGYVVALSSLSSQNAGAVTIPNAVFGSNPDISDDTLAKAFQMALPAQNINHSAFKSMFEREKLSGSNFNDWFHSLKLVLRVEKKLNVIEQPLPPAPITGSTIEAFEEWNKIYDVHNEVECLMLGSMTPELHRQFENSSPYDMLQKLKSMFEKQVGFERNNWNILVMSYRKKLVMFEKQAGFKMKGYVEQLEHLGYVLLQEISVSLILNDLTSDFAGFVRNYNIHNMGKTIGELHALVIGYDKGLPKMASTSQVELVFLDQRSVHILLCCIMWMSSVLGALADSDAVSWICSSSSCGGVCIGLGGGRARISCFKDGGSVKSLSVNSGTTSFTSLVSMFA
ncbi:putative germin-like protein 2-1 [Tanacetum coccineum]|uniref:Germin-like protein 2-1 n=1 Tax=Tanacetum coccineum TaxID=301880 RepID=A0ABQ5J474_9ASTR